MDGKPFLRIDVPGATANVIATVDGTVKQRRIGADGKPECAPLLPHEFPSRLSSLGVMDPSAQPVPNTTLDDLDSAERARLRQFIERFNGDKALLGLTDEELDGALGLTVRQADGRVPTLTGMLLIGKEGALRDFVPTHEFAFQVREQEDVRLNEFSRAPLVRLFEWAENTFVPLNPEQEMQVGLFRVPVPRVDRATFREALANALTHRDYARLGTVFVRFEDETLVISNPGGFVDGVRLDNLLTIEPRPRNPRLADALKRVGLVERTGRGVDLIYRGLLRYGRPPPDYSASGAVGVVLRLSASDADLSFLRLVLEAENKRQESLPIDSLIALAALRDQKRLTVSDLIDTLHRQRAHVRATLEALVEAGLVESHGTGRARTYTLAARVYRTQNQRAEYTRQVAFDGLQQEQMVLNFVGQHGSIVRSDVMDLCHLSKDQAGRLLARLVAQDRLVPEGEKRGRRYLLPEGGK